MKLLIPKTMNKKKLNELIEKLSKRNVITGLKGRGDGRVYLIYHNKIKRRSKWIN